MYYALKKFVKHKILSKVATLDKSFEDIEELCEVPIEESKINYFPNQNPSPF